jgi:hypothetical protein
MQKDITIMQQTTDKTLATMQAETVTLKAEMSKPTEHNTDLRKLMDKVLKHQENEKKSSLRTIPKHVRQLQDNANFINPVQYKTTHACGINHALQYQRFQL